MFEDVFEAVVFEADVFEAVVFEADVFEAVVFEADVFEDVFEAVVFEAVVFDPPEFAASGTSPVAQPNIKTKQPKIIDNGVHRLVKQKLDGSISLKTLTSKDIGFPLL